jgi:hypothetical protein
MHYDPKDHIPSAKAVAAAWIICVGVAGLALGMTAAQRDFVRPAVATPASVAKVPKPDPLTGVRIPEPAMCRADPTYRTRLPQQQIQGPMSVPVDQCS